MKITLASALVKNNNLKRTEKFIDLFHRVSIGWKEYTQTDGHYCEGKHFNAFEYEGKRFAVALCGDCVLLVNPYGDDARKNEDKAAGGAACFKAGMIEKEMPAGSKNSIIIEI